VKVVVATPYYPPHVGGAERYCREICVGLRRRRDWSVVVATSAIGAPAGISDDEGVVVHRMPARAVLSNTPVDLSWRRRLARLIDQESPDVVVAHSPVPFMADVAALASGDRPFVLTYHAGPLAKGRPLFDVAATGYERLGLRRLLKQAAAVVHYSPEFGRVNARLLEDKVHVVAPGVDLGQFSPNGPAPPEPSVLYVGRMERSSRWKGVRHLLDAVPQMLQSVPDLTVDLVGAGDDAPSLRCYARSKGLDGVVKFHGALTGQDLVERYRKATLVVLPSTTAAESFGMVLLEAAACGRPAVASRVGGIPAAVLDGETGLLVPPGNADALAEAVTVILNDYDLARSLGTRAAERARAEFSWDAKVDATGEILEGVLA
jgi:glycosyltransferase involved in cell wall biosynthesis